MCLLAAEPVVQLDGKSQSMGSLAKSKLGKPISPHPHTCACTYTCIHTFTHRHEHTHICIHTPD